MAGRIVLHVDFDYFYAQCEEARRPELSTGPLVVCVYSDRGGDSGAVATANYSARRLGIKSGMPIRMAKGLGDGHDVTFLPTDFEYYSGVSAEAMEIMRGFADVFEYVGRDEAYLDVTQSTESSYEAASHLAQRIKNAIRGRLGLTCSVGVSPNRLLSKIASDHKKPDGLTVVRPGTIDVFLAPLLVGDIPGIGRKTGKILEEMGMRTVAELLAADIFLLQQRFGRKMGAYIHKAARGEDDTPVAERGDNAQYSKIVTLREDSADPEFLAGALGQICARLYKVVAAEKKLFKSVTVQFVQSDMSQKSRSRMLRSPVSDLDELERCAGQLLTEALEGQQKKLRRLGVKVSELSDAGGQSSMDSYF